jgi:hypothetical protein
LCADGFIIRAQATIRTDGFFVRAGFAKACALRAPTPSNFYGYTPSVKIERGFEVNRTLPLSIAVKVNFEMRP